MVQACAGFLQNGETGDRLCDTRRHHHFGCCVQVWHSASCIREKVAIGFVVARKVLAIQRKSDTDVNICKSILAL